MRDTHHLVTLLICPNFWELHQLQSVQKQQDSWNYFPPFGVQQLPATNYLPKKSWWVEDLTCRQNWGGSDAVMLQFLQEKSREIVAFTPSDLIRHFLGLKMVVLCNLAVVVRCALMIWLLHTTRARWTPDISERQGPLPQVGEPPFCAPRTFDVRSQVF